MTLLKRYVLKRQATLLLVVVLSLNMVRCTRKVATGDALAASSTGSGKNHLGLEKSPYLKQHASNPVWWYPWGVEALNEAKKQNKLIFLSIGYSTCHWCHVMERESYGDPEVASALNKNFIAIKVDREERPDVDAIYMDAVQAMTGSGGWPLNTILTPDRKPFFGGTYFKKSQLLDILGQVSDAWRKTPEKIADVSKKLGEYLEEQQRQSNSGDFTNKIFSTFYKSFANEFDPEHGGKKGAPKFVPTYGLRVLLRIYRRTEEKKALLMVQKTLDEVSRGGIYDHLGGGFHRYSTDDKWLVPHFEKMLYDQAAQVEAYLEAYQVTKSPEYRKIVIETLDYVLRDLTSPDGAFYSAEDADSEGVEGKFYVWTKKELKEALKPDEFSALAKTFGASSGGNFEGGTNILNLQPGASRTKRSKTVRSAMDKLMTIRSHRIRPSLDSKVLTSWNGLMISAMAKSARVLGEPKYAEGAAKAAQFAMSHLKDKSEHLLRRWVDGEAKLDPYDEDYSFLIDGLIELYQADFNKKWLLEAVRLQADQDKLFWDHDKGGYFLTTGNDKSLLRRGKNYLDNVTPSGNSISILNLIRLGDFMVNPIYKEKAMVLIQSFPKETMDFPTAFPQMTMALDYTLDKSKEIAIVAKAENRDRQTLIRMFADDFNPNQVIAVGSPGEKEIPLLANRPLNNQQTTIYICTNQVCKLPTNSKDEAKHRIAEKSFYRLQ